jgi:trk system potassium uptake protein TrkH
MHSMALPAADSFRHGFFQSISIMTTTGFSTVDFNLWPSFARTVLLMLMIIGASSGSTGGALKITRFIVLFKYTFRRICLTFNPQAVIPIKVGGTVLNERVISGIIGMAILYFTCIFIGFLVMAGLGLDPLSALSSVLATLGNVGPGLGVVGPLASYAPIPALGKVVLILAMLAGRLELLTIFALLTPSFWKWR